VRASIHFSVTILILALSAFIAYIYPNLENVYNIFGGTCGTLLSVTIPYACYYKLNGRHKVGLSIVGGILTIIGFSASLISLLDGLRIIDLG
jgi:amino acid permease